MTFEDILIEQDTETKKTVQEALEEIKDMISRALSSVKKCMALGAITISLIVLSLNLFGDGLRDAFDPKLKH